MPEPIKISVVMPVHNAEAFLAEAIESILNQSFCYFEFIIVNDGSTDESLKIIGSFNDPRIKIINNEKNLGLAKSLNRGIMASRGKYIARMDADDIAREDRLEIQYKFLEKNNSVDLLGSGAEIIDENGSITGGIKRPTEHALIKWHFFNSYPMVHPSVMVKSEIIKTNPYNETEEYFKNEDIELWRRLLFNNNYTFANLPDPLLKYRIHSSSMTRARDDKYKKKSFLIRMEAINKYITLSEKDKFVLLNRTNDEIKMKNVVKLNSILKKLYIPFEKEENLSIVQTQSIKKSLSQPRFIRQKLIIIMKRNIKGLISRS